jgi:hypothetical protein
VINQIATRWATRAALVVLLCLISAVSTGCAITTTRPPARTSPSRVSQSPNVTPTPTPAAKAELGLFVYGESPAAVSAVASSLGVTAQVMNVCAYDNYTEFTFPPGAGYQLMLCVGAVTPAQASTIGENLLAEGYPNTIIRIMWEPNGNWFPWGFQTLTATQYIKAYRAAEEAFAAVPGNHFKYVWDVSAGSAAPGRSEFDTYPGNGYVTNIGFDWYDYNPATKTGVPTSAVPPILTFAANHDKPVSIDEWGMNGVDDPSFVNYVASVVRSPYDRVTLQVYFDYGPSTLTALPRTEAAYVNDFG